MRQPVDVEHEVRRLKVCAVKYANLRALTVEQMHHRGFFVPDTYRGEGIHRVPKAVGVGQLGRRPVLICRGSRGRIAQGDKDDHLAHRAGIERGQGFAELFLLRITGVAASVGGKTKHRDLAPHCVQRPRGPIWLRPFHIRHLSRRNGFKRGFLIRHRLVQVLPGVVRESGCRSQQGYGTNARGWRRAAGWR